MNREEERGQRGEKGETTPRPHAQLRLRISRNASPFLSAPLRSSPRDVVAATAHADHRCPSMTSRRFFSRDLPVLGQPRANNPNPSLFIQFPVQLAPFHPIPFDPATCSRLCQQSLLILSLRLFVERRSNDRNDVTMLRSYYFSKLDF